MVPKGSHRMPDGTIMKNKDMPKSKKYRKKPRGYRRKLANAPNFYNRHEPPQIGYAYNRTNQNDPFINSFHIGNRRYQDREKLESLKRIKNREGIQTGLMAENFKKIESAYYSSTATADRITAGLQGIHDEVRKLNQQAPRKEPKLTGDGIVLQETPRRPIDTTTMGARGASRGRSWIGQTPPRPPPSALSLPHEEATPPPPPTTDDPHRRTPPITNSATTDVGATQTNSDTTDVGGTVAGSGVKAAKSAAGSDISLSDKGNETFDTASEASAFSDAEGKWSARSSSTDSDSDFVDALPAQPYPTLRKELAIRRHAATKGAQITPREPDRPPMTPDRPSMSPTLFQDLTRSTQLRRGLPPLPTRTTPTLGTPSPNIISDTLFTTPSSAARNWSANAASIDRRLDEAISEERLAASPYSPLQAHINQFAPFSGNRARRNV